MVRCGAFATKARKPWSSKQVSRVPLYASAPIGYDGPVYARVDVARWSRDCTVVFLPRTLGNGKFINIQIRLAMVQAVRRTDIYDSSKKVKNETKRHKSRDR